VLLHIEPDGKTHLFGTYDKFHSPLFSPTAIFYPQSSIPELDLVEIGNKVGKKIYQKGISGYIAIGTNQCI
jgi:hypothetical protein